MDIIGGTFNTIGTWIIDNLSVEGIISLPALMVGFLVAIAIYNFEDSGKGLHIDAPTVISKVVGVNSVLVAVFLVSLLPITWGSNKTSIAWLLPILAIVYLIGLSMLTQSLRRAFNWAKSIETGMQDSFRSVQRAAYITTLKDEEKRAAWEKIWQADEKTRKLLDERQIIKLFIASIKNTRNKELYSPWLVQDFISSLNSLPLSDPIIMYDLVDFCLEGIFQKREKNEKSPTGELHYFMNLRRLFFQMFSKTLEKDDNSLYTLISRAREYIRINNLNEAEFVKLFAPSFFTTIEKKDDQDWIWESFPNEWRITLSRLLDPATKDTTFAWLNAYSSWLSGKGLYRYGSQSKEISFTIDKITNALFPTIDTLSFSRLFAFQWSGFGLNDGESSEHAQVRNAVENRLAFGYIGHSYTNYGVEDNEKALMLTFKREYDELIDLAAKTTLFPSLHDKPTMRRYLKAINELKSDSQSDIDKTKGLQWLDMVLRDVRKRINKLNESQRNKTREKKI